MVPEYGFEYFQTTFNHFHPHEGYMSIWKLILICKDKLVRSAISQIILQSINVTIEHRNISLDANQFSDIGLEAMDKDENLKIAFVFNEFLTMLWSEIPNLVSSNWMRF